MPWHAYPPFQNLPEVVDLHNRRAAPCLGESEDALPCDSFVQNTFRLDFRSCLAFRKKLEISRRVDQHSQEVIAGSSKPEQNAEIEQRHPRRRGVPLDLCGLRGESSLHRTTRSRLAQDDSRLVFSQLQITTDHHSHFWTLRDLLGSSSRRARNTRQRISNQGTHAGQCECRSRSEPREGQMGWRVGGTTKLSMIRTAELSPGPTMHHFCAVRRFCLVKQ